jgi:hypothetical protein
MRGSQPRPGSRENTRIGSTVAVGVFGKQMICAVGGAQRKD